MIAKRVAAHKKGAKAKAGGLIRYIADEKHDGAKVVQMGFSNLGSEDYRWAIREFEAVQAMNTRSQADKTYHLVVSFQEGEDPTAAVLEEVEREIAQALGYGAHQRVSAVHNNTDNLHLHIAINKVHPERFTVHEPYYDHYRLSELCQRLEIKHGLKVDNHAESKKTRASRKLDTDELLRDGITPLNEWLKEKITSDELSCWEDLHGQAALAGASLVIKGNGLAFVHQDSGIGVKASSVSRSLSKANLVKHLGDFEPQQNSYQVQHQYDGKAALASRASQSSEYWSAYQVEKETLIASKHSELDALKRYQADERKRINDSNKLERARIKLGRTIQGKGAKKKAYQILYQQKKSSLVQLNSFVREERKKIYTKNKAIPWREFLKDKAKGGDYNALNILRNLQPEKIKRENFLFGENDNGPINVNENQNFKDDVNSKINDSRVFIQSKTIDSIDQFISNRNETANKVSDLKRHIRLSKTITGEFTFEGLRRVDDKYVLLCGSKEAMGVLAIDKNTFNKLKKLKRHSDLKITNGAPAIRGRKL
jgi:Relaxase/Mobilisation nuclease domain